MFTLALLFPLYVFAQDPLVSHSLPSSDAEDVHSRQKRAYWFPSYQYNLLVSSEPPNHYHKRWITWEHNRHRKIVPSTDMHMLYWSEELAYSAQRHADTCDFRHSRGRVNVGENIWAAPYSNYSQAMSIWFDEVYNPSCQCSHSYKHCCGHYVQMVWAKTTLVGCGFSRCRDVQGIMGRGHRNVFVCHYNPQGNTVFVTGNGQLYAMPAFRWVTPTKGRCSECPASAPACYEGLCYKPSEEDVTTADYPSEERQDERQIE